MNKSKRSVSIRLSEPKYAPGMKSSVEWRGDEVGDFFLIYSLSSRDFDLKMKNDVFRCKKEEG